MNEHRDVVVDLEISGNHGASTARRQVAASLESRLGRSVPKDFLLAVSELVSNSLQYAEPPCWVRVLVSDQDDVRVEVEDSNPTPPSVDHGSLRRESGRGLRIVDAVSSDWGVTPADTGKFVWFEFPRAD